MIIGNTLHILNTILHKWLRIPYPLYVRKFHKAKRAKATVLFIHGLGSTGNMWDPVIRKLPGNINIVTVDLLGFGRSPKPYWETYDAKLQARALLATYIKLRLRSSVIVVGHSLGALVAIEFAKRYPRLTKSLVLCSPPIYRHDDQMPRLSTERILTKIYRWLMKYPKTIIKLYGFGRSTKIDTSLEVTEDNVQMFTDSMQASIINQTAIDDIAQLPLRIDIIHGLFDPLVIRPNLVKLANMTPTMTLTTIRASHVLNSVYTEAVIRVIAEQTA